MPYGRDETQWEELIGAGLKVLQDAASGRGRKTYSELNDDLLALTDQPKFNFNSPDGVNGMSRLLANISERGMDEHPDFLITAVVVGKTSFEPGLGFYTLGESTGLLKPDMDKTKFWVDQMNATHEYYAAKRAIRSPKSRQP